MADFTNQLLMSSIYHLLNFEKYTSFPMAAREAALASEFQIVLFSEDFSILFSVETMHRIEIQDIVRKGIESNVQHSLENTKISYAGVTTYWGPCEISGNKYYLMLVDNKDYYSQEDIIKLAEIIELAMGMWNYRPTRDINAEFVRALRRGNTQLAISLMKEIGIKREQLKGVFLIPKADREEAMKIIANYEEKYGLKSLKIIESKDIVGVILESKLKEDFGEPEWKSFAKEIADCAGAPRTFHVMGTKTVLDLCSAFTLISETEAFVNLIFPLKHSFTKYELALANNCVNICMQGGSIKQHLLDLLAPLNDESDKKSRDLMNTLECFMLDSRMNAAKTAKLLNIHSNTVQYRLNKIREILGVDITGNTVVPGIMTALAVSRIEKEVKSF